MVRRPNNQAGGQTLDREACVTSQLLLCSLLLTYHTLASQRGQPAFSAAASQCREIFSGVHCECALLFIKPIKNITCALGHAGRERLSSPKETCIFVNVCIVGGVAPPPSPKYIPSPALTCGLSLSLLCCPTLPRCPCLARPDLSPPALLLHLPPCPAVPAF